LDEQDFPVPKNCCPYIYLWRGVSRLGRKNGPDLGPFSIALLGKDLGRDFGDALVTFAVVFGGSKMATGLSERLQFPRPF
jgi:hypothetical protein